MPAVTSCPAFVSKHHSPRHRLASGAGTEFANVFCLARIMSTLHSLARIVWHCGHAEPGYHFIAFAVALLMLPLATTARADLGDTFTNPEVWQSIPVFAIGRPLGVES
jgi:hypothetical protein